MQSPDHPEDKNRDSEPTEFSDGRSESGESPDLLRWRADALLDEMMLGAVDLSAADNPSAIETGTQYQSPSQDDRSSEQPVDGDSVGQQSAARSEPDIARHIPSPVRPENVSSSPEPWMPDGPSSEHENQESASIPRVEDRYYRSSAAVEDQSQSPPPPVAPFGQDTAASGNGHEPSPESAGEANGTLPYQDAGYSEAGHQDNVMVGGELPRSAEMQPNGLSDGRVKRDSYVNEMSVAERGERRSNLLPRMSAYNVQGLKQEIGLLREEIASKMPIGHESTERARSLLDKADAILAFDPLRTAEVEYYIQQVRSIVQRIMQTYEWSSIYRKRLRIYLVAWAVLSLLMMVACWIYPSRIELSVAAIFGFALDGVMVQHITSFLGVIFAGSLGGSVGALFNMRRHAEKEAAFFDRKYGLRGLILPIIGVVFGAILYMLFGLIYGVLGVDPSVNRFASMLPALLALVFGLSQESIYGTLD